MVLEAALRAGVQLNGSEIRRRCLIAALLNATCSIFWRVQLLHRSRRMAKGCKISRSIIFVLYGFRNIEKKVRYGEGMYFPRAPPARAPRVSGASKLDSRK